MRYFDNRGVSMKYEIVRNDNALKWWRNAPDYSQHFTDTFIDEAVMRAMSKPHGVANYEFLVETQVLT
jgi:hypothetical protein